LTVVCFGVRLPREFFRESPRKRMERPPPADVRKVPVPFCCVYSLRFNNLCYFRWASPSQLKYARVCNSTFTCISELSYLREIRNCPHTIYSPASVFGSRHTGRERDGSILSAHQRRTPCHQCAPPSKAAPPGDLPKRRPARGSEAQIKQRNRWDHWGLPVRMWM